MRVAPAAIISCMSSAVRIPPAALTPILGPTASRMSATVYDVAPAEAYPVDVFT